MAATKLEDRIVRMEQTFSRRIAELEAQVAQLSQQVNARPSSGEVAW